jgi:hypothetical protein
MAKGDRWSGDPDVEVRAMRNAETVLGVIRERTFKAETTGELLEIERLTSKGTAQIAAEICSKVLDDCSGDWKVPVQALSAARDNDGVPETVGYAHI